MSDQGFINEFYKLLNPADPWTESTDSLKAIFETKLQQYGLTTNQAEKLLSMQKRTLEGILDRSAKRVDVVSLLKLGQFLGLNTDTLFKIFLKEAPHDIVGELEDAKRKSFIVSNFDVKNLYKSGFIKSKSDFDEIEKRIVNYFGFNSIYQYATKIYIPAFSKTKRSANLLMKKFWVRSAYSHFEKINNPNPFNRTALVDLIPKIRPYTMNVESGLKVVSQALFNAGVTVIYQPHLPTTQVRGATFVINGKPSIVLTDLNQRYASIWFALMHELYHVLYDMEEIEKQIFHLTGEPDLFLLQEDQANDFSREYLFGKEKVKYIRAYIDSPVVVEQFAKKNQVHPSLVYTYYCYDSEAEGKGSYWAKYYNHQPDVKKALHELNVNTFDKESIDDTVKYLNEFVFNI
ncbi:ImmA/IrrE family metallo-endopeptidase [Pedobacter sp. MR2016-24]|uniref:ImmA/IrrE family metallo-endopeptidase n=1 Tax=Pedobacter sp. MR2016-24 TaxID=2994466 RepID=UPI002247AF84|nr:hypothetical protein [Pedobacter sp. MR2016-24]MCX2483470.1 hypothetical protein [Pedobacter sp. MR2016-24]